MPHVLTHVPVGQYNLPVPLLAILGASVVVVAASFVLIYLSAPSRVSHDDGGGLRVPPPVTFLLTLLTLAYVGFVILVASFGRQAVLAVNPAAVLFWVWTIPLLPLAHCLVGGVYPVANPFAFIARHLAGGRHLPNADAILRRLGYWPAVALFFLLTCAESIGEIVQRPAVLGAAAILYLALQVIMGILLGEEWYAGGEVFCAITTLASTLAPCALRRDEAGTVRLVTGFDPARFLPRGRGREALVTLWLAGVLADGVRSTPIWRVAILPHTEARFEALGTFAGIDVGSALEITLEITLTWAAFGLFFWAFVALASLLAGNPNGGALERARLARVAGIVSPSLIPIALAYLLAHNLTQLLVVGPLMVSAVHANVGELSALTIANVRRISPEFVWWTQVIAIVLGHVVAVVMAHVRLTRELDPAEAGTVQGVAAPPPRRPTLAGRLATDTAFRADLGWLSAMLIYTASSLWILAQPITA